MRAGKLDRRVTIESYTKPTGGDPTAGTWSTLAMVWAERLEMGGVERALGVTVDTAEATGGYRIRYRSDVDPTCRLVDGSELWDIVATPEGKGRDRETILLVRRLDPDDAS